MSIPRWRRIRSEDIPAPDDMQLDPFWFGGPLAVEMEVKPHGDKWQWSAWLTFGGNGSMMDYATGGTFWHPEPCKVHGRCRNQGTAWIRARAAADDARARFAAKNVVKMRTHGERAPL